MTFKQTAKVHGSNETYQPAQDSQTHTVEMLLEYVGTAGKILPDLFPMSAYFVRSTPFIVGAI